MSNEQRRSVYGFQPALKVYRLPDNTKWLIVARNVDGEIHSSELVRQLGDGAVLLTVSDENGISYYADNQAYHQATANPTIELMKEKGLIPS